MKKLFILLSVLIFSTNLFSQVDEKGGFWAKQYNDKPVYFPCLVCDRTNHRHTISAGVADIHSAFRYPAVFLNVDFSYNIFSLEKNGSFLINGDVAYHDANIFSNTTNKRYDELFLGFVGPMYRTPKIANRIDFEVATGYFFSVPFHPSGYAHDLERGNAEENSQIAGYKIDNEPYYRNNLGIKGTANIYITDRIAIQVKDIFTPRFGRKGEGLFGVGIKYSL